MWSRTQTTTTVDYILTLTVGYLRRGQTRRGTETSDRRSEGHRKVVTFTDRTTFLGGKSTDFSVVTPSYTRGKGRRCSPDTRGRHPHGARASEVPSRDGTPVRGAVTLWVPSHADGRRPEPVDRPPRLQEVLLDTVQGLGPRPALPLRFVRDVVPAPPVETLFRRRAARVHVLAPLPSVVAEE